MGVTRTLAPGHDDAGAAGASQWELALTTWLMILKVVYEVRESLCHNTTCGSFCGVSPQRERLKQTLANLLLRDEESTNTLRPSRAPLTFGMLLVALPTLIFIQYSS